MPASAEKLHQLVIDLHLKMGEMAKSYEQENQLLREKIHHLQYQLYGRKSEKYVLNDNFEQMFLFGENDKEGAFVDGVEALSLEETVTIPEHQRKIKKSGRKPLPDDIPRVEVIHDLSPKQRVCECGCEMSRIGEESSEKLEMQPPQFWVLRNIRYKYACKGCEGVDSRESGVKLAPAPVQLLPKSFATPSLLAHLLISKFSDALPFYRQEKQFQRYGIKLPRATMCNWTLALAEKFQSLLKLLRRELLSGPYLGIDETTIQVLNEPGRSFNTKSYMWVFQGGPPGKRVIIFQYSPRRTRAVVRQFLGDYHGYIQTDGYTAYDYLDHVEGITHVGCWAHARRKFVDVYRLYAKDIKNENTEGKGKSGYAIKKIRQLYKIEREADDAKCSEKERYHMRQEQAGEILDDFEVWLKENVVNVPAKSKLGQAFKYIIGQWPRLSNYLKSGVVPIDNNLTENAIRPFVVGRKNWLFSDQPSGAEASALFYSFIETARANGLEPYSYLLYLFDRFPYADTEEELKKLLPTCTTPARLVEHKKEYWLKFKV